VFPVEDQNPRLHAPVVTRALIALNVAVFVYQFFLLSEAQNLRFVHAHGAVPAILLSGYGPALSTPFTSMFIHGGLLHLVSNMLFLGVFGDNVEDVLGKLRFVVFYLVTGVAAVLVHALITPDSRVPLVGASGAISGVLGAYAFLFPRARVRTWLLIFPIDLPAFAYIAIWFFLQVQNGLGSLAQSPGAGGSGVAFFAHVGGFIAGVALLFMMGRPKGPRVYLGPRVPTSRLRRR
jgi:membrane associated rhomboid family serine protease